MAIKRFPKNVDTAMLMMFSGALRTPHFIGILIYLGRCKQGRSVHNVARTLKVKMDDAERHLCDLLDMGAITCELRKTKTASFQIYKIDHVFFKRIKRVVTWFATSN